MIPFDSFNFIGNYKFSNENGVPITYEYGDLVINNSRLYAASKTITGVSPEVGEREGWIMMGKSQNFFNDNTVPFSAKVGDEWIDSATGRVYKYIKDDNGKHWVET
tara:strand:- start:1196 stop:1513 length:318 start_codon:yes stop_codon:yes gene_type:complete